MQRCLAAAALPQRLSKTNSSPTYSRRRLLLVDFAGAGRYLSIAMACLRFFFGLKAMLNEPVSGVGFLRYG